MIDPKQLRLNNLVTIDNERSWPEMKGVYCLVNGIEAKEWGVSEFPNSSHYISVIKWGGRKEYHQFNEFISPIPLTDEVLRRTNFKETAESFFEFRLKQGVIFYYDDSLMLSYGDYVEESGLLPHIDALHLLQNLVAVLSGTELEIKP